MLGAMTNFHHLSQTALCANKTQSAVFLGSKVNIQN